MHRKTKDGAVITIAGGLPERPPNERASTIGDTRWIEFEQQWYRWDGTGGDLIDLIKYAHRFDRSDLLQLLGDESFAHAYQDGVVSGLKR